MAKSFPVRNPPNTLIRTSHGIQIKVNGVTVGAITKWTPAAYTRQMTHIYELNPLSSGHPIDVVPGNLGGFKIAVNRYDIWKEPFEKAFTGDISLMEALGNQVEPFDVYQYFWNPDGYKELVVYSGCWFDSIGREFAADATRVVMVTASLTFIRRDRIL